jgi:hypothetical protein
VSASGISSEQVQVILAERLSPIQNPDAPTSCENSGLAALLNTYGLGAGIRLVLTGLIIITAVVVAGGHKTLRN